MKQYKEFIIYYNNKNNVDLDTIYSSHSMYHIIHVL